ncbi:hypothetical protein EPUS_08442 [Endocarpon pusillum Z07020]|uniref:F-box domain-containing protein n=1 Tax=Endocarpon pusillum (strain Z07020 / HMAS-L-300199) TaxID=1263415 RepID=U1GD58_ENDPU|nr:uncharacterized protein EPUS_08442 [Endocarpon pusillum Z07020]ERF75537.1 hypothetical protein EPUS_08442 [Endocarpon pusillum Z07020]
MASVWHDGLVEAFPVPVTKLHSAPFNSPRIEDAIKALTLSPPATSPFPFFSLPAEIRNRIYSLVLFSPTKSRKPSSNRPPPTSLYLISSRTHREASYIFYTTQTFRLFPLQEFKPLPTVSELPPRYRSLITNTELILGPGWTAPPKSWKVTQRMAKILRQLCRVRCLRVFVEVDPSHPLFARFRVSHGFYTEFAGNLLRVVLVAMPQVEFVQLDGNPSVQMDGPLVVRLRTEIEGQGRVVKWGKERGWSAADREGLQAEIKSEDVNDWTAETQSSNEMLPEVGTASARGEYTSGS